MGMTSDEWFVFRHVVYWLVMGLVALVAILFNAYASSKDADNYAHMLEQLKKDNER